MDMMKEADMSPCGHYPDARVCAACITMQTPMEQRPKCSQGHLCEMAPSHRWCCAWCREYAAGIDYSNPDKIPA